MRGGSWNPAESMALTTGQHQRLEQQHQAMAEEQQQPLLSAATPAWGLGVSMDTNSERNDSGISPGNYTSDSPSPRSRRCSENADSLSPGSSNFQESAQMNYNGNCDYSAKAIIKTVPTDSMLREGMNEGASEAASEAEMQEALSLSEMEMNESSSEMEVEVQQPVEVPVDVPANEVSSTVRPASRRPTTRRIMQCPLCRYVNEDRDEFLEHLKSHCIMESGTNPVPEETEEEDCSDEEYDSYDDPQLRTPHINAQGKVKVFACKRCPKITLTKYDSWIHQRTHIRPDKLLFCRRCPFTTEYKHHLEYHMRNHYGSKPFKCPNCPYACVNKSMLNSHLKSHSSVYQYRCVSCGYATKYCHSLKLHLRKYVHQPATVLNPDGTPNPNPVIDVYGTRRGPRPKPTATTTNISGEQVATSTSNNCNVTSLTSQQTEPNTDNRVSTACQRRHSLQTAVGDDRVMLQTHNVDPVSYKNPIVPFSRANEEQPMNVEAIFGRNSMGPILDHGFVPNPNGLFPSLLDQQFMFPVPNQLYFSDEAAQQQFEMLKNNPAFLEYVRQLHQQRMNGISQELPPASMPQPNFPSSTIPVSPADQKSENGVLLEQEPSLALKFGAVPLDLSKPECSPSSTNKPSNKRRRKGKAVKLDQRVLQFDSDSDDGKPEDTYSTSTYETNTNCSVDVKKENKEELDDTKDYVKEYVKANGCFVCDMCDMFFRNEIMYAVHMGYHGRQNPFTCNICGQQCADEVSFFVHIARVKH